MREIWQVRYPYMKLTYDPRYNIAYLRLHAKTAEVETIHVSERVDEQGHILGFSVLGVSRTKKDRPLEAEIMTGK